MLPRLASLVLSGFASEARSDDSSCLAIAAPIRATINGKPASDRPMQSPFLRHCIDAPPPGSEFDLPFFWLQGWIASQEGAISELAVRASGTKDYPLRIVERSDVAAALSDFAIAGFGEFASIDPSDLTADDWHVRVRTGDRLHEIPLDVRFSDRAYQFWPQKQAKLQRIRQLLHCPACGSEKLHETATGLQCRSCDARYDANSYRYNFLSEQAIALAQVKPTENVSSHPYDSIALDLLQQHPDWLVLDNGCGLRDVYRDNVVNFDIANYPTTDVTGVGERLPFRSGVFDAIFSLSVLEHVRYPFACASEIARVLKPDGMLYVVAPFMHPFHGYPDNYYNMTSSGLKNLFSDGFEILECKVPMAGKPIWCLSAFLNAYLRGLPEPVARQFAEMKVGDLIASPLSFLDRKLVTQLSPEAEEELATLNYLLARRI